MDFSTTKPKYAMQHVSQRHPEDGDGVPQMGCPGKWTYEPKPGQVVKKIGPYRCGELQVGTLHGVKRDSRDRNWNYRGEKNIQQVVSVEGTFGFPSIHEQGQFSSKAIKETKGNHRGLLQREATQKENRHFAGSPKKRPHSFVMLSSGSHLP